MRYGLPYQGSKNDIAQWVIDHLPPADVLIDAFAGGCAITHCAMLSHKFKRVIANDVNDIPSLFVDAIKGKYRNETRWISREDFFALKDTDPYVRVCWSYGNNGSQYLYNTDLEPYKKAYHFAVLFGDYSLFDALNIDIPQDIREGVARARTTKKKRQILRVYLLAKVAHAKYDCRFKQLQSLEGLERLQSLERLERLQSLERLENLERSENLERLASLLEIRQGNFSEIPLPQAESYVIYCDPPYNGRDCKAYKGFNHERFYEWLRAMSVPVIISEYDMPSDFVLIDERSKLIKMDTRGQHKGAERLFCHESTIDKLPKTTLF